MANLKFTFNFILYLLCFSGFLFQCYDLYFEYMSGKTVVNIRVETILNQTLPAITVCYSTYYTPDTLKLNDSIAHEFKKIYEEENEMIRLSQNKTVNSRIVQLGSMKVQLKRERLLRNMKMVDFFEKLTIPISLKGTYSTHYSNHYMYSVSADVIGFNYNRNEENMKLVKKEEKYLVRNPIESIMATKSNDTINNLRKCFTFFSHLQKEWRNFKIKLNSINFQIIKGKDYKAKNFHLAIHSGNVLPNFYDFIEFKHYKIYTIRYSEVQTQLLGSGFDTNCFEYDLNYKFANYNMRSDCITSCMKSLSSRDNEIIILNRLYIERNIIYIEETLHMGNYS